VATSGKLAVSVLSASLTSLAGVSAHSALFALTSQRMKSRRRIGAPGLNAPDAGSTAPSCASSAISFSPFTPAMSVNEALFAALAATGVATAGATVVAGAGDAPLDASPLFEQALAPSASAEAKTRTNVRRSECSMPRA